LLTATLVAQQPVTAADPFGSVRQPTKDKVAPAGKDNTAKSPDERIRQALNLPCTLEYDEEAWSDIEADLESKYGFNIVISQSARDDSLSRDELISINLRGIRLGNSLRLMLIENNATYVVKDEALIIFSIDDREDPQFFTRRFFDVSGILRAADLLLQRQDAQNPKQNDGGMIEMGTAGRRNHRPLVDESSLIDLILHSVQPDAWRNNPYPVMKQGDTFRKPTGLATCNGFCGHLIVNGPEKLLDELDDFKLRRNESRKRR
jgi:hypothetical protein